MNSVCAHIEYAVHNQPNLFIHAFNATDLCIIVMQFLQDNLRESDQYIYQEFEKVRAAIDDIKEARQQEEKRLIEDKLFDEYFGTLLGTRQPSMVRVQGRSHSLQLPVLNNGRKPSQSLV